MAVKQLWKVKDVAEYTGFDPETIRRRARLGTIPVQRHGGQYRFDPEVIKQWWEAGAPRDWSDV